MSDGLHKGLLNMQRTNGGEAMGTALGAGTGRGTWYGDVPQVADDGRKVGTGIGVQETVVRSVGGTKVGTDIGIGDFIG